MTQFCAVIGGRAGDLRGPAQAQCILSRDWDERCKTGKSVSFSVASFEKFAVSLSLVCHSGLFVFGFSLLV